MDILLSMFPVVNANSVAILHKGAGFKYDNPMVLADDTLKANMRNLLQALAAYDNQKNKAKAQVVRGLINQLGMIGVLLRDDPGSLYIYAPEGSPVSLSAGPSILWHPGKIKTLPEHTNNPNFPWYNALLSDEHPFRDFAENSAIALWRGKTAKFMFISSRFSGATPPPPGEESRCQSGRNIADVAHSIDTLYAIAVNELTRQLYPDMNILSIHGVSDKSGSPSPIRLRGVNSFNSQFLTDGNRSFPQLFFIALSQHDFLPATIGLGSTYPGSIIVNNKTYAFASEDRTVGYFVSMSAVENSNVPDHIVNGGGCVTGKIQHDKALHLEFPKEMRVAGSEQMALVVEAYNITQHWFLNFTPAMSPYNLPPKVLNNMREYPSYVNQLLNNPTATAASSTSTAAARLMSLAVPAHDETKIIDNLDCEGGFDDVGLLAAAGIPLTFSTSGSSAAASSSSAANESDETTARPAKKRLKQG